jgi:hypothetical protein
MILFTNWVNGGPDQNHGRVFGRIDVTVRAEAVSDFLPKYGKWKGAQYGNKESACNQNSYRPEAFRTW